MYSSNTPAPAPHAPVPHAPEWLGHPKGLFYLFFAEMWERFCYYGMRAILVLYMVDYFHYSDDVASGVYGAYTGIVYCVAMAGGHIADRYLGYRASIMLGGVLMAAGEFLLLANTQILGIGESLQSNCFFGGLATIIVGNAFFKPNISTIVGKLYAPGDRRRDAGFTIFYMGINIGALVGGLLCGFIGQKVNWTLGFGVAGIGMLLGVFTFSRAGLVLGGHGNPKSLELQRRTFLPILLGSIACIPLFAILLKHNELLKLVFYPLFGVMLLILVMVAVKEDKVQREKIFALLVLLLFTVAFFAFFEQAGNSLTLFAQRNVDLTIFGWVMPSSWVQQVNPLFIIALAPLFSVLWMKLGRRGAEPSIPAKFAYGVLQDAAAFGIVVAGAQWFAKDGMTPLLFMVMLYVLQTTGELCLSPVGLSMVTKLAPERMTGMVMGAWFLTLGMANYLAGEIGKLTKAAGGTAGQELTAAASLPVYTKVYFNSFLILAAAGVVLLLLVPLLRKWMHGVK